MQIFTIYKITNNINGKSYIGFDSNFPNRILDHKREHLKCKYKNSVFYRALKKFGWENFSHSILYQSKEKLHTKNVMENYFITEYNTFVNNENSRGYNMTLGGDGVLNAGDFWTEERRKNQSEMSKARFTGKPKTESHKKNLSGKRPHINQTGSNNNAAQAIITPFGIFACVSEFIREVETLNIQYSKQQIYKFIYDENNHEWKYLHKKHKYVKSDKFNNRNPSREKRINTPYGQFDSITKAVKYISTTLNIHMTLDIIGAKLKNEKFPDWNYLTEENK